MPTFQTIGKRLPRVDALDKVTGAAQYAADVNLPGQLWGAFVRSPHSHARIKRIDTANAETLSGVKCVITGASLSKDVALSTDDTVHGMKVVQGLFATDEVVYQGEKIAVVVAEDWNTARDGAELVEVEYEVLPALFEVMEAIKPESPKARADAKTITLADGSVLNNLAGEAKGGHGEVEAGFAQADRVFEDWYTIPRVHQLYLEPHAVLAKVDPSGKVIVWTSTQSIFAIRSGIAASLGIPLSKINVIGTTIGGGFGAKFGMIIHPYAVLAAQRTGRPVKLVFSREEEFLDGRPAPGLVMWVKTGVKNDGTITARQAIGYWDTGCTPGASMWATSRIMGVYKIPNIKWEAFSVYTNKPGPAAYRAPGAPQASFASEAQLDKIARTLGLDPVELRLKNMCEDGDGRRPDEKLERVAFKETLKAVAERAGWWERNRKQEAAAGGSDQSRPLTTHHSPLTKRGWGVAIGEWQNGAGPGSAIISISEDGTAHVTYGMVDITGVDTAMAQIAAEAIGLPFADVQIIRTDTDTSPYATGSGGSVVTFSMGNAVKRAAEKVHARLFEIAAHHLECSVGEIEMRDRRLFKISNDDESITVAECAQQSLRTTGGPILETGTFANEPSHPVIAAQIFEVEVDPETGRYWVTKAVNSLDCGRAINPMAVEGQMEGGLVQGLAWGWMEQMEYGDRGNLNASLLDYRLPTTLDLPLISSVIIERESRNGPYGVKGVGEPPIAPGPAALYSALADAVGVEIHDLPITPEKVWRAMRAGA